MAETKLTPLAHTGHHHPDGKRCCGRPLAEKCTPEEEAARTDSKTGEKACCKGKH
jgi:hypothetical protein